MDFNDPDIEEVYKALGKYRPGMWIPSSILTRFGLSSYRGHRILRHTMPNFYPDDKESEFIFDRLATDPEFTSRYRELCRKALDGDVDEG